MKREDMLKAPAHLVDHLGTVHACPVVEAKLRTRGSYNPRRDSFECGCAPLIHRFKCNHCKRFVGWCMGADDEYPDFCDDCWSLQQERNPP